MKVKICPNMLGCKVCVCACVCVCVCVCVRIGHIQSRGLNQRMSMSMCGYM